MAIGIAYAMYASVMHGRLVFFGPTNVLHFGVSDQAIFAQLKRSIAAFLKGDEKAGLCPPASKGLSPSQ